MIRKALAFFVWFPYSKETREKQRNMNDFEFYESVY